MLSVLGDEVMSSRCDRMRSLGVALLIPVRQILKEKSFPATGMAPSESSEQLLLEAAEELKVHQLRRPDLFDSMQI